MTFLLIPRQTKVNSKPTKILSKILSKIIYFEFIMVFRQNQIIIENKP